MDPLVFHYRFDAEDGTSATFEVALDPETLLMPEPEGDLPDWTLLEYQQCPHCPFTPEERRHCPAASHLPGLVEPFNHLASHARARVEVTTAERTFVKDASIQQGIGSLMGLIMATSGCPHLAFFRPMARFHLPFSTQDETIFRATSVYLLADHFRTRNTEDEPDRDLAGLTEAYRRVHTLNRAMADRLRVAARADSSLNALVHLDMFALMLPIQARRQLPAIMKYFEGILEDFPRR